MASYLPAMSSELIEALVGHVRLSKIALHCTQIGRVGYSCYTALVHLLHRPSSSLIVLDLYGNYIDNEWAGILSSDLNGKNTLREIYLGNSHVITMTGWQAGFNFFKCQNFRVEKSDLNDNCGGRTLALSLKNALSNTNTTKTLVLCNMGDSGTIETTICQLLLSPTCMLESLDLSSNEFNHRELESLVYCDNIHSWISTIGDLASSHQQEFMVLNSQKGFWRSLP